MTSRTPDLILHSGQVWSEEGWVEAIAIVDGIIKRVGTSQEILASELHDGARVIDLSGRVVLPGLHDLHVHPIFAGVRASRCRIPQGSSLEETLRIVGEAAAQAKPGEWVLGGQWDASALGGVPNRYMLDSVAPNVPVVLEDTSAHSSWANSMALSLGGVSAETPDPQDGIYERDEDGEPTGIQRETAAYLLAAVAPTPTQADVERDLAWALHEMLSFGITSFTEAALGFTAGARTEIRAYNALAERGVIKQRVRISITWEPAELEQLEVIEDRNFYACGRMKTDGIKIFLDGVPTDGHTAAMLQPYADTVEGRDDEAGRHGMLKFPPDILNEAVANFDRLGLTVKFHAAGDAAVRAALDAIEFARVQNGIGPQMHNVGHCTFVSESDIVRAREIGATFEVSPYLWQPTPICSDIAAAVGPDIIRRVWPIREMLDSGALVVAGSDWSVVPSVNPWIGIETMVTREEPGGSVETFGKEEAVTIEEALEIFTANAARQEGMADRIGRIAPGLVADVIVVDRNPLTVSVYEIHATQVDYTIIEGEVVFDRAAESGNP